MAMSAATLKKKLIKINRNVPEGVIQRGMGLATPRPKLRPNVPSSITRLADPRALGPQRLDLPGGHKDFAFKSAGTISSGAKAITTSIFNYFAAANIDFVTVDGQITGDVRVKEVSPIMFALREAAAAPGENLASIVGGGYLVLSVNGAPAAWYPLEDFRPVIYEGAVVTNGGAAAFCVIPEPVPFEIDFDPDATYALDLELTTAVTLAANASTAMGFKGSRMVGSL